MDAREFARTLRAKLQQMNQNRAKDALRIANDLNALVRLRINTRGQDYKGKSFTPYSPGYKKKRQRAGRQTRIVDFNFTGRLQAATQSYVLKETATSVIVSTTARGTDNQNKLRGALTQPKGNPRGNILRPSQSEIQTAEAANRQRILKYLQL